MTRLVLYGSLRRGEENHRVIADIPGRWTSGRVEGVINRRFRYPRYRHIETGKWVEVDVLESAALRKYFRRIDLFEGEEGYRRVTVPVRIGGKIRRGYVYEAIRS